MREILEASRKLKSHTRQRTILFLDEIHRFNRAQQDVFLPFMETGEIVLIGATTENPSFELNGALLSRCKVVVLDPLTLEAVARIVRRALRDIPRGLGAAGAPRGLARAGGGGCLLRARPQVQCPLRRRGRGEAGRGGKAGRARSRRHSQRRDAADEGGRLRPGLPLRARRAGGRGWDRMPPRGPPRPPLLPSPTLRRGSRALPAPGSDFEEAAGEVGEGREREGGAEKEGIVICD